MKVKIIVDSSSDYTFEEASKLNLGFLSMKIHFGENEEYLDGRTISKEEFFTKLSSCSSLPHTSQINPYEYTEAFEEALKDYDRIICFCISSKLSGSYQNACLASQEFNGKVSVIDTLNVCVGYRILVEYALKLLDEGKDTDEVISIIEKEKHNICLIALLDTLEYLKKGGRISSTTAFVGTLLNIKPVISISEGKVKMEGKARGSKNGNNKLREYIFETGGIDFKKPYACAYSGNDDSKLQMYIRDSKDLILDDSKINISLIGATIGTHIGPGGIAVAYFKKQ